MAYKILIVDDSSLMRTILKDIIDSDPELEVIDTASNGEEAIEKIRTHNPDLVTMDVMMPGMDGVTAVKEIMMTTPKPIIMVSALTEEGSRSTFEAISNGAADFILKPNDIANESESFKMQLIPKIKACINANTHIRHVDIHPVKEDFRPSSERMIVIASSTGGPASLEQVLKGLPKDLPTPILIVQHMPEKFTKFFADRLNSICEISVKEAEDGEIPKAGTAYIAPGNYHMELKDLGQEMRLKLNQQEKELGVRPNGNRLFISVANIFKENTIGIVLTGMGYDGTEGSRKIKELGGTIIAESKESCVIYGMPKSVIEANLADEIVNLKDIARAICQVLAI